MLPAFCLKQQKLGLADQALETVRRAGDLLVAAFFTASKDKERDKLLQSLTAIFSSAPRVEMLRDSQTETGIVDRLRGAPKPPVMPFHWKSSFPEVFARERPAFDALVGNPPFMGPVQEYLRVTGASYRIWLLESHTDSHAMRTSWHTFFSSRIRSIARVRDVFGLDSDQYDCARRHPKYWAKVGFASTVGSSLKPLNAPSMAGKSLCDVLAFFT